MLSYEESHYYNWSMSDENSKVNHIRDFWAKNVIIFLSINLNMCCGCSKESPHWDGSFEHTQHMFWLRNKIKFLVCTFNKMPSLGSSLISSISLQPFSVFSLYTYRLLHGFFDPSPDLNPSRPYQPEPEGRGLILSEGWDQGWDQKSRVIIFLSYTYACKRANEIIYQFLYLAQSLN